MSNLILKTDTPLEATAKRIRQLIYESNKEQNNLSFKAIGLKLALDEVDNMITREELIAKREKAKITQPITTNADDSHED